ncbi:DUF1990 family protein [Deinococcus irradiatisoli]|uniref:DUF1990 family protein n=1 Tax=Deinococcus irradiatisoli TaxID=2202254 RepID=UPI0015E862BF|nr:DUF1990 family protein [Deinococcus irradiatisoli]
MNWRWPLGLALVLPVAYQTRFLRFPVDGWRLTQVEDGVGPLTYRSYWLDIRGSTLTPESVVTDVLQRLPEHLPSALAHFRRVRPGLEPTRTGDRFTILMFGLRRARVEVVERSPRHFRLQTLRQHSESGWVEFTCDLEGDVVRITVKSLVRSSSWGDRLAYLFGVAFLQRLTWESGIRSAWKAAGGTKVAHGTLTEEWP